MTNYANYPGQLSGAGSAVAQLGQVEKSSQIEVSCNRLDCANEELRALVAGLQVRLQTVLMPQMKAEAQTGTAAPTPVRAPLADRLETINSGYNHSLGFLRDIIDRLAV